MGKTLSLTALLVLLTALPVSARPDLTPTLATVSPSPHQPVVVIPKHAVEVAEDVFSLGTATVDGETVEGLMFIHRKDEPSHKPGHPGGAAATKSSCYAFLASGARWKVTEPYVLDTTNADGMSDAFVAATIEAGFEAWDAQVAFDVFGPRSTSSAVDGVDTAAPDNKNEIFFGAIADPGVIAATTVWGVFSGPTFNRKLVEFDMVFDDLEYAWGDATLNPTLMDLKNISTHEEGHAGGMGHPADSCTEETMYRFAGIGETKKRDLNAGDIAGVKKLYQ